MPVSSRCWYLQCQQRFLHDSAWCCKSISRASYLSTEEAHYLHELAHWMAIVLPTVIWSSMVARFFKLTRIQLLIWYQWLLCACTHGGSCLQTHCSLGCASLEQQTYRHNRM